MFYLRCLSQISPNFLSTIFYSNQETMSPMQILCLQVKQSETSSIVDDDDDVLVSSLFFQLAFMLVSYQVLANPAVPEAAEATDISVRNILSSSGYNLDNLDEYLPNVDNYESLRRHFLNKLSKRRAQAKANLAGLWGVPTRFA